MGQEENISPNRQILKNLIANKLSLTGMIIIGFFLLIAILGPSVRPDKSHKANQQFLSLARKNPGFQCLMLQIKTESGVELRPIKRYEEVNETTMMIEDYNELDENLKLEEITIQTGEMEIINKTFFLGTDRYGRDLLSRLMAGTWISFTVGFISIIISLVIGIFLGSLAGFYRGKLDELIMWFVNVVWSVPTLLLVIAITLALGKGFWQVFVAVGLTMWVEVARVVRGQFISMREKEFVEAGQSLGYNNSRIIFKHILPNVLGPVIVISAANFAAAILIEAGLSFLGLGAQPPQATWGKMIAEHKGYIITGDAYLAIFPGIAIFLLVLSFVLVGNGLRDAFDTKGVKSLNL